MSLNDYLISKRAAMRTEAIAGGNHNPYHSRHIEQFCDYADAVGEKVEQRIREDLPNIIMKCIKQPKYQVEVDENSLKRVHQKISSMLDSIFGKR